MTRIILVLSLKNPSVFVINTSTLYMDYILFLGYFTLGFLYLFFVPRFEKHAEVILSFKRRCLWRDVGC